MKTTVFTLLLIMSFLSVESYSALKKYRSFRQYPLSSGLPGSLKRINAKLQKKIGNNIVYIIMHMPEVKLDYNLPSTTMFSIFRKSYSKIDVGHVQLAWSCKFEGKKYESATGFSGDLNNTSYQLVAKGYGLSPLVSTYMDGYLESPSEVDARVKMSLKKRKVTILAVNVRDNCKKIIRNIWKFVNSERSKYFSIANFAAEDRQIKGHNCTSLIVEWLKPAGKIYKFLKTNSLGKLEVPINLFGNPEGWGRLTKTVFFSSLLKSRRYVSVMSLMTKWNKDGMEVHINDPNLLISNVKSMKFEKINFKVNDMKTDVLIF